jgi:hypothetical protein
MQSDPTAAPDEHCDSHARSFSAHRRRSGGPRSGGGLTREDREVLARVPWGAVSPASAGPVGSGLQSVSNPLAPLQLDPFSPLSASLNAANQRGFDGSGVVIISSDETGDDDPANPPEEGGEGGNDDDDDDPPLDPGDDPQDPDDGGGDTDGGDGTDPGTNGNSGTGPGPGGVSDGAWSGPFTPGGFTDPGGGTHGPGTFNPTGPTGAIDSPPDDAGVTIPWSADPPLDREVIDDEGLDPDADVDLDLDRDVDVDADDDDDDPLEDCRLPRKTSITCEDERQRPGYLVIVDRPQPCNEYEFYDPHPVQ